MSVELLVRTDIPLLVRTDVDLLVRSVVPSGQVTQLSALGTPGRVTAFVAKGSAATPSTQTAGWFKWRAPRATRPSYKGNYARSVSEAAYPGLRKSMAHAWIPALGPTGVTLRDVAGTVDMAINNTEPGDWIVGPHGYALDFDGVDEHAKAVTETITTACSLHVLMKASVDVNTYALTISNPAELDDQLVLGLRSDSGTWAGFGARNSTPISWAKSSIQYPLGTWAGITGVAHGTTDRRVYLNGANEGTDTTNIATGNWVRSWLGGAQTLSPFYSAVQVAVAYVWDRALTAPEIRLLGRDSLAPFRLRAWLPMRSSSGTFGQLCVKAEQIYTPGAKTSQLYVPGSTAEQIGC